MILKVFLSHQEKGLWQKVKSPLVRSQFKFLTPSDKRKEHKKLNASEILLFEQSTIFTLVNNCPNGNLFK